MAAPNQQAALYAIVIGALVAQLREGRKWTQKGLADRVGVTQSAISRIERGQAQPDPFELRVLADAFEMTTADFTKLIDDAFAHAAQTAKQAIPNFQRGDWWGPALAALGVIGFAGLAAFVVAKLLHESEATAKQPARSTAPGANRKTRPGVPMPSEGGRWPANGSKEAKALRKAAIAFTRNLGKEPIGDHDRVSGNLNLALCKAAITYAAHVQKLKDDKHKRLTKKFKQQLKKILKFKREQP